MEKQPIAIRLIVNDPLSDVVMQVQKGRNELLAPVERSKLRLVFELELSVSIERGVPNFLGPFAQGPKRARFIYLNSGSYAGQAGTRWDRRAKISLMDITAEQVKHVLSSRDARLEISMQGRGKDGGPICASVKPQATSGWKVTR